MGFKVFLFLIFFSFSSYGKGAAQKKKKPFSEKEALQERSFIQSFPKELSSGETLELSPVKDHEFNLKAHSHCGKAKLLKITKGLMQCRFSKKGIYQVETYICDKEKTICYFEQHKILVKVSKRKALKKH